MPRATRVMILEQLHAFAALVLVATGRLCRSEFFLAASSRRKARSARQNAGVGEFRLRVHRRRSQRKAQTRTLDALLALFECQLHGSVQGFGTEPANQIRSRQRRSRSRSSSRPSSSPSGGSLASTSVGAARCLHPAQFAQRRRIKTVEVDALTQRLQKRSHVSCSSLIAALIARSASWRASCSLWRRTAVNSRQSSSGDCPGSSSGR